MREENLLDVLIYLFGFYANEDKGIFVDDRLIGEEMVNAGFNPQKVTQAVHWLRELSIISRGIPMKALKHAKKLLRIYSKEECSKISLKARNYLLYLERAQVIDATFRELIIDRAMALELNTIDVSAIKWITFMVLFKMPYRQKIQMQLLATLILDGDRVKH